MQESNANSLGTPSNRLDYWLGLGLVGLVVLVFWPALQAGFVDWDDPLNILQNPHLGLTWENLCWMFTDVSYAKRYLPLGWLSYSIDRTFFGGSALSYHLGNLILHSANTLIIFAILKRVLRVSALVDGQYSKWICWGAAAGAAWWALNPLRAEPVAWASSRIYCTASFFYFLSVLLYLRAADSTVSGGKRQVWWASLFFGLSLFTYPIALGGVAIFLILDLFLLGRLPRDPRKWLGQEYRAVWGEKAIFLIPIAVTFGANFWARMNHPQAYPVVSLEQFGIGARLVQALWVWAWYLWKPLMPVGLNPKYPDLLMDSPFTAAHLGAGAMVCLITVFLFWRRERWPGLLALWLCHLAILFPFIGVTEHPHFTFDRYSYIPGAVWTVAVACVAVRCFLVPRMQLRLFAALAVLVGGWLGVLAQQQTRLWGDSFKVQARMAEALGEHPERAQHDVKVATYLMEHQRLDEAETLVRKALVLQPKVAVSWVVLGDVLCEQKRLEEGIAAYQHALGLDTEVSSGRQHLGVALAMAKRFEESVQQFEILLRRNPKSVSAHHNMALALHSLGKVDEARQHMREVQRLKEGNANSR